jgi:zinc protease
MSHIVLRHFFLCLPIVLFSAACSKNYQNAWTLKNASQLRISKRISAGELPNGVKYYYLRNDNPKGTCLLRLNVGVGSFYESENELGMAHMVEHLAFDDRPISKDQTLNVWLQNHGMSIGGDANAYTTNENTLYHIDLPNCNAKEIADTLAIFRGFADGLQFREEAIAKEKNIIDAEDREYRNSRGKLAERLVGQIYSGTSHITRPLMGKTATRANFTKDSLLSFYQKWYHPKNLSIVLVGDYGDLLPANMITNAFASLTAKADLPTPVKSNDPDYRHPVFIVNEPEMPYIETFFSVQEKKMQKPEFSFALIKDRIAFDLALDIISHALSANAKKQVDLIREPELNGFMIGKGKYELTLSTVGNAANFEQSFKDAFMVLKRASENGFSEEEFVSAKNAFSDSIAQWWAGEATWTSDEWLNIIIGHINQNRYGNDATDYLSWAKPILTTITAKDCQNTLKEALKSGNDYIFAIGSIEESDKNVKQLADLLANVKAQKVETIKVAPAPRFEYQIGQP